ncbi:hypothetical protein GCM10025734_12160 [Kitasatospora paranensis]
MAAGSPRSGPTPRGGGATACGQFLGGSTKMDHERHPAQHRPYTISRAGAEGSGRGRWQIEAIDTLGR